MQNTLQINNGITNLWKLIMLVLLKQIELGRLFDMDNDGYKDICLQRNLP
jgi:phosphoribosyl-dephospho-CoA transferase